MLFNVKSLVEKYWPFVLKSAHNKQIGYARKEKDSLRRTIEKMAQERDELLKPMVAKFLKTQMTCTCKAPFRSYVLRTELDSSWVEQCLIQGGSASEIEVLCDCAASQIRQELVQIIRTRNIIRTS